MAGLVAVLGILPRSKVRIGEYGRSPKPATVHTRERETPIPHIPKNSIKFYC